MGLQHFPSCAQQTTCCHKRVWSSMLTRRRRNNLWCLQHNIHVGVVIQNQGQALLLLASRRKCRCNNTTAALHVVGRTQQPDTTWIVHCCRYTSTRAERPDVHQERAAIKHETTTLKLQYKIQTMKMKTVFHSHECWKPHDCY